VHSTLCQTFPLKSRDLASEVLLAYTMHLSWKQNIYAVLILNLCEGVTTTELSVLNAFLVLLSFVLLYTADAII